MIWKEFEQAASALASFGEVRFDDTGVILLGTLRRDGSPRISPVEPLIVGGQLCLGMMWQSRKALDLLRDPRCTVHSATVDRENKDGDFKLFGRGVDVQDLEERRRYGDALFEKIGWRPEEPNFHVFAIDIESAASVTTEGDALIVRTWKAQGPSRVDLRKITV